VTRHCHGHEFLRASSPPTIRASDTEGATAGVPQLAASSAYSASQKKLVTLKMHDLKMTDKENYGSGKCRTGK